MEKRSKKVVVEISKPTLRTRLNREELIGIIVVCLLLVAFACAGLINLLTSKVDSVIVNADLHFVVSANEKQYSLQSDDILRVERTVAKQGFTGQDVELLKVYTTEGFIYAVPTDSFYPEVQEIADALDKNGSPAYMPDDVNLNQVQEKAYAIGTPKQDRIVLFLCLAVQNLAIFAAGVTMLLLIFPLRGENENDTPSVLSHMEQPA